MSQSFKWGTLSDSETEYEFDELGEKPRISDNLDDQSCCIDLTQETDYKVLIAAMEDINEYSQLDCHINTIRSVVNSMIRLFDSFQEHERMSVLNEFLRMRHESLSRKLAKALVIDEKHTDIKFSEIFEISSDRTPDFIHKFGEESYLIIEVSAVNDVEKAHKLKGTVDKGYLSKYNKEIELLRASGLVIHYKTVIFNMSDTNDKDYSLVVKEISELTNTSCTGNEIFDLEFVKGEWITQTHNVYMFYSGYLGLIFGQPYTLANPANLDDLDFVGEPCSEYKGKYNRVAVSSSLFDKVTANLPRMPGMAERAAEGDSNQRLSLYFDMEKQSFSFLRVRAGGKPLSDWHKNLNRDSKIWVCENLNLMYKGSEMPKVKAEFEFFEYNKGGRALVKGVLTQQLYAPTHLFSKPTRASAGKDFRSRIHQNEVMKLRCKFEDEGYEERILAAIRELDEEVKSEEELKAYVKSLSFQPLCSHDVTPEVIKKAVDLFDENMDTNNRLEGGVHLFWAKPPFLYPLAQMSEGDYCSYKEKPTDLLNKLSEINMGPYTNRITSMIKSSGFEFGTSTGVPNALYEDAKSEISKFHKMVLSELKDKHRCDLEASKIDALKGGVKAEVRFPKMASLDNAKIYKETLSKLNSNLYKIASEQKIINKNIGVLKLGRGVKNLLNKDFKQEMLHFRDAKAKSHYKGVGMNVNPNTINGLMDNLKSCLLAPSNMSSVDDIFHDFVSHDNNLLKKLKTDAVSNHKPYADYLKSTNLYHSCAFISRLCHSLMYHSQTSLNSAYVAVDNLGYNNTLLLVKGGKKVFRTKRSKLFRLIHPTYSSVDDLYHPPGLNSSFTRFVCQDRVFMITPWMNMHETLMSDGLTMLHRTMGFALMNLVSNISFHDNLDRVFFNIILSLHNRRQSEVMLHNLRYIFMNCMSTFSAITEILPELAGFNYDTFQYWVRNSISKNFQTFANTLLKLHNGNKRGELIGLKKSGLRHPFNNNKIEDVNTLALSIYSSYLMSKSPTTQTLEQVKNLKSMMKIHHEFESNGKTSESSYITIKKNLKGYSESLFESDFNFDPKYCFLLGKFMGDYLGTLTNKSLLSQKWDNTLDKNWDEVANTKGLRGRGSYFFGNKGYYVVYKEVLEQTNNAAKLLEVLNSDMDPLDKEKELKKMNESFRGRIKSKPLDQVVFHVVDKVQRGGSREIFVMDMETKVHQQVLEDFMKQICKMVPNEMISIPSNRRLSSIHSKVFEDSREQEEKYYWVLDCRKWAPKSMIEKFMIFLMGAKEILPESFYLHSMNFFTLLREKKIFTRPHIVELMTKSEGFKHYKKYFTLDEDKKAYYFEAKYSWVMGIFNYFSSLMHVANQLHIAHLIKKSSLENLGCDNILHMVAHSDDSAGKIMLGNKYQHRRASLIYEIFMHSANHLLSKKKCNQGQVYYEFISILYIGGVLLSLLAKFSGMFNFHPTDKGYCSDITDAYSKCTEMLLNGATFEQCYVSMKIQAHLIYKFYFNTNPSPITYDLPPGMFGFPDAHPLMVLMCGSDADLFRLYKHGSEDSSKSIQIINDVLLPLDSDYNGMLKAFTSSPNVSLNNKMKNLENRVIVPDYIKDSWTLKNVKFGNDQINAIQFLMRLKDKTFVAAMQDESMTRRISRAYYFRSHMSVKTSYGDLTPRQLQELIFLLKRALLGDTDGIKEEYLQDLERARAEFEVRVESCSKKIFDFLFTEITRMDDYMCKISYQEDMVQDYPKNCKPVYITLQKTVEENPVRYNPQALCSWIKEPQHRSLLPDTRGFNTAETFLNNTLQANGINVNEVPPELLFPVLQKLQSKSRAEYFCYSNVPGSLREISTYQDMLNFLSHNSFKDKQIQGLGIQFQKTMGIQLNSINDDLDDEDFQYTLSLLTLANAVLASPDFSSEMLSLKMKRPVFLNGGVSNFLTLLNDAIGHWRGNIKFSAYINCQSIAFDCLVKGERRFSAQAIEGTFYHSFIKRQQLVDNVWLGMGKLFVSAGKTRVLLVIINTRVERVLVQSTEHSFERAEVAYINICLKNAQLPFLQENMIQTEIEDFESLGLCVDQGNNYYIGNTRGSIKHLPAIFDQTLSTPLTQYSTSIVRPAKRGKLYWECGDSSREQVFTLSTLPVEIQNSINILRGSLIDDIYNKEILKDKDSGAVNVLMEVCADMLELEQAIDFSTVLKNYQFSKMYHIMKLADEMQLCTVFNPKLKQSNFPAADGGLLNLFVNYSRFDPKFNFRWQRAVSPEYMMLKSTQPEAFISEFVITMKDRYDSLYTSEDKDSIHSAISTLSRSVAEGGQEEKLMNLLCTWGYVGVAGALDDLGDRESVSNFERVRCYSGGEPYLPMFSDSFFPLVFNIYNSYKSGLGQQDFSGVEARSNRRVTSGMISMHKMSFTHSVVLTTFSERGFPEYSMNEDYNLLTDMLSSVLGNPTTRSTFRESNKSSITLRNLPCDASTDMDWMVVLRTLMCCYREHNKKEILLDFSKRVDQSQSFQNPYVTTKTILAKDGVSLNAKKVFHYGALSSHHFDYLAQSFKERYGGKLVFFNSKIISPSEVNSADIVVLNKDYHFESVLTQEFIESDQFMDIDLELQSSEACIDSITECVEDYESGGENIYDPDHFKKKKVKVVVNGKMENMIKCDLNVVLLLGGSLDHMSFNRIRQLGQDVLVVCNSLPISVLINENLMCFRNKNDAWKGMSITDPQSLYYVILTRDFKDPHFWSKVLSCDHVTPSDFSGSNKLVNFQYRNDSGKVDTFVPESDANLSWQQMNDNLDARRAEQEATVAAKNLAESSGGLTKKINLVSEKMLSEGLDEEQVKKYRAIASTCKNKKGWEEVFRVLMTLSGEVEITKKGPKNAITEKMNKIVASPKEPLKHEMIMQVPRVFGGGRKGGRVAKNSLFRESKIIAEIESFCPGLIWKVLAGTLYVTRSNYEFMRRQILLYKKLLKITKQHLKGKQFLINLCTLILNDAVVSEVSDESQNVWQVFLSSTQKYMMLGEDEEDEDDEENLAYSREGYEQGVLNYKISGSQDQSKMR